MAHSHANTLLQKMGFSDSDRRTPLHDKACVSLVMGARKLIEKFPRWGAQRIKVDLEKPLQKGEGKYASTIGFVDAMLEGIEWTEGWRNEETVKFERYRCPKCGVFLGPEEAKVTKWCKRTKHCTGDYDHGTYVVDDHETVSMYQPLRPNHHLGSMLVEVKTKIESVGDLLRQMNLYREYGNVEEYVVWSLDPSDAESLELMFTQGINLVVGPTLDELIVHDQWARHERRYSGRW